VARNKQQEQQSNTSMAAARRCMVATIDSNVAMLEENGRIYQFWFWRPSFIVCGCRGYCRLTVD
jgi:hypothetical protein